MFYINHYSHPTFLIGELKRLLPDGSFAARLWRTIGYALDGWLLEQESCDEGYSQAFPVDALFLWTRKNGLGHEWLANDEGHYLDDAGNAIPPSVKPSLTAAELLAAYGLWLLLEEMNSLGPISETGADVDPTLPNEQGFTLVDVTEHRAECMLRAYQALCYSQRILAGAPLTPDENARAEIYSFSSLGKAGAKKRHAPMAALRSWAVDKYRAGKWQSANQAAHALKESIMQYGRTINANLTEENAQRTIAEWFRKSG